MTAVRQSSVDWIRETSLINYCLWEKGTFNGYCVSHITIDGYREHHLLNMQSSQWDP